MPDPTPHFAGRVVDPDVDDGDVPVEQLSVEPPVVSPGEQDQVPDEPGLRPQTFPRSLPSEVLLDPAAVPPPVPEHRPRRQAPALLSPSMTAVFGALFGLAAVFAIFATLQRFAPHKTATAATQPQPAAPGASTAAPEGSASAEPLPNLDDEPGVPGPWRVAALKSDDSVRTIEGTVGLEPLLGSLEAKHVSKKEIFRVVSALKTFKVIDKPGKHSRYVVAIDKASGRVRGFELELSPTEVYQARENDQQQLVGEKLDMKVATRRTTAVLRVGDDLPTDLRRARLRESVAEAVNRAFDGRAHLATMHKGSTLRLVVVEQTALGKFSSYEYVEALEYVPAKEGAEPLRIYRFRDGSRWGYFDQKGREPFKGGWRKPCPGSPVTSPFNPKRLHPILKIVKPHLGTDFGAPAGTPIHAAYYGTVSHIGPQGPAGNLIILKHPGDIETYYMHQSRFAPGLKVNDKVETFQIIGYVGTTGRSTGPHLHFGVKKKNEWVDPMSLKMDGERTLGKEARPEFDKLRAEFDAILDSLPLPEPAAAEPASAASPPSAAAAPSGSAEPAHGEEESSDDELEPEGASRDPRDNESEKGKGKKKK